MAIFTKQNLLSRVPFNTEKPFEKEVFKNHELFFGKKTILIDAKIRLEGEFANTIPDGYLFDFSNEDEPVLYMVEIEIEGHDFHNHILPQMAKFGAVFKSDLQSKIKFATTLSKFIRKEENKKIKDKFINYLGNAEVITEFLIDIIDGSTKILLVMNGKKHIKKNDSIEKMFGGWENMIKSVVVEKFSHGKDVVYQMEPDWEIVEIIDEETSNTKDLTKSKYKEEYHTKKIGKDNIRKIYTSLKTEVKNLKSKLLFAPKKNFISVDLSNGRMDGKKDPAIFLIWLGKRTIRLTLFTSYEKAKKHLKTKESYTLRDTSQNVRSWYGTDVCNITIKDEKVIGEVIEIIKEIINETPSQ